MCEPLKKQKKLHYIHIGKTGGSAIQSALEDHLNTSEGTIVIHGHNTSLADIPEGEQVIFFLRDPISRFISGFYSRQRKGQPRYYSEWSPEEKVALEMFSTPNEIACALAQGNRDAIEAMKNVIHFEHFTKWYESLEYFQTRIEDIFLSGFKKH